MTSKAELERTIAVQGKQLDRDVERLAIQARELFELRNKVTDLDKALTRAAVKATNWRYDLHTAKNWVWIPAEHGYLCSDFFDEQ